MAILLGRVRVIMGGWQGAPGLSQMYFRGAVPGAFDATDALNAVTAVHTFWTGVRSNFANSVTAQVQAVVSVIEATTGALVAEIQVAPPAVVVGSGGASYGPISSGASIYWHTTSVFNDRLLRGRTFLSPLIAGSYNASGAVSAIPLAAIKATADALVASASADMVVWHRPFPTKAAANGGYGSATGATVSDKASVLRSRRD